MRFLTIWPVVGSTNWKSNDAKGNSWLLYTKLKSDLSVLLSPTMKIASGSVLLSLLSSVLASQIQVPQHSRRRLDDEEEGASFDEIDEVTERECELGE